MINRLRFLKILSITLAVVLVTLGCASNNLRNRNILRDEVVELTVENVPEGVLLNFSHIPPETTRLFVHFIGVSKDDELLSPVFADIRGDLLDQVRETRRILCPFVLAGHNYVIGVSLEKGKDFELQDWIFAEIFVENNGIHVINDLALELNNTQTGVTLSAEPVFSSMVRFSSGKYSYKVTVMLDGNMSISYGGNAGEAMAWDFSSFFTSFADADIPYDVSITGIFPAYVTAYSNLDFENISWYVGIARSDEFSISL